MLKRRIVVALLFSLVAGVGYAVYALRVDQIRVTGVRALDPRQVIEASGLKGGERILWIRLSSVARRIERLPAVESVTAERSFPQTIVLNVSEREPQGRLGGRGGLAVDAEGHVFPSTVVSIPVVEGWRGPGRPGTLVDGASIGVLRAFSEFPERLRRTAGRLDIGPPMNLVLRDGTEIRFGFHTDLVQKARVADAVLAAEAGRELAYVDVRAPEVPVSRKREPPTPVPTAAPTAAATPAGSPAA
jgi:cell division protein FtsQ